jgi:WG containing repeat
LVIKPQFDDAGEFSQGLAVITIGGKKGFINKQGTVVIQPQFDYAYSFSEGLAPVKIGDKYGYIRRP